jgi:acylphosphatase
MSSIVTRRLHVHGAVQGVWYRESMRQQAEQLGVTGWVRNRLDGSVEAMVQGAPDDVETMIAWAKRGPERAQVANVIVTDTVADAGVETFNAFSKLPTY